MKYDYEYGLRNAERLNRTATAFGWVGVIRGGLSGRFREGPG